MFTVEQYRARYARSTSQELLELLAIDPASLTPQARQALADETAQRGLERGMSLIESVCIELGRPRQFLYPKAPLPDRFGAYIVDQIIALGPVITAAIFNFLFHLGTQSPMVRTFNYVATIAWAFYYTCTRDARPNGQSIGKEMFGLMVVNTETDRPCTLGQAIGRGLSLVFLNSIPFVGWLIEPIAATGSSDGRRIGDRLAGTQVIRPSVDDATRHESLDVDEGLGS